MSVDVRWLDQMQRILVMRFSQNFTVDDLRQADILAHNLTQDRTQPFYLFYNFQDVSQVRGLPSGMIDYIKEDREHTNSLESIVVIAPQWISSFARSMIQIAKVMHPDINQRLHLVRNQSEALSLLQQPLYLIKRA